METLERGMLLADTQALEGQAKLLIEEYAYRTISEVAYAVGFSDAHYFSNLFYKQYGAMPKDLLPG